MEIRPFILSFLTVSSVAPVERSGTQQKWWYCSTTDLGVDEGQSLCVPLDSPAAGAKTHLSSRDFRKMWWKKSCASCSAKSGRIAMVMTMVMMIGNLQTTPEGGGPNHMKLHYVRPAGMAFAHRMKRAIAVWTGIIEHKSAIRRNDVISHLLSQVTCCSPFSWSQTFCLPTLLLCHSDFL